MDHAVGFECSVKTGDKVRKGEPLGYVHCRKVSQANAVSEKLKLAYKIGDTTPKTTKLIRATV